MPRSKAKKSRKAKMVQGSRPSSTRRRRPKGSVSSGGRMGGIETRLYARSLVDPWNVSACIPDAAAGVGCFSIKQLRQIATGTGTACAFVWNLSVPNCTFTDTGSANATPTLPAASLYSPATNRTAIQALYQEVRPVSGGIRATYIGNTQTDQGILLIGQVAEGTAVSAFDGANLTTAQALMQNYKILPLRSGGQVTWRPTDIVDTVNFNPSSASPSALSTATAAPFLIAIVYAANASSSVLLIDAVTNFEGQFNSQTFLPGGINSKEKVAEPGWFETGKNLIRMIDPIVPYVQSTLSNVFNSPVASTAMQMLLNPADRTGLPRRRLGYMDVD